MKHVLLALLMVASVAAFAEGEGGVGHGGGVAYVCDENGQQKVYLADTYDLTKAGAFDKFNTNEPESIIEAAVLMLEVTKPEKTIPNPVVPGQMVSIGWLVKHTSASLNMDYSGTLPLQPDAHITNVPAGCKLAQLAIQEVGINRLKVDLDLLEKLSWTDRGLFKLHEIWISIRNQPGADTTPIRAQVSAAAQLLADPNFSESAMIGKLIAGPKFISTGILGDKTSFAMRYVMSHCNGDNRLLPTFDAQTLSEIYYGLACPHYEKVFHQEMLAYDKSTALPTLTAIPQELDCTIVNRGGDMLNWKPTKTIRITRTVGNGMPYSPDLKGNDYLPASGTREYVYSKYQVDFMKDGQSVSTISDKMQSNQDLHTSRHERQRGIDELGDLDFRLSYDMKTPVSSKSFALFIHSYLPMTNLFYGSIQMEDHNTDTWASYGVACSAPNNDIKYDKDLYGSWN